MESTHSYLFFQNGTNDIANNDERNAIRQAFQFWADAGDLAFLEVCNAASADLIIAWETGAHGDGAAFDGQNGVLAHAFAPPPLGGIFSGDVHFDEDEDWVDQIRGNSSQPIDLVTTAAHEIGHSLGLDHTQVPNSLMNAAYNGSHRFLGSDDILGIQNLYGSRGAGTLVTGNYLLCSSGSYMLQSVPPGTSVSWSVSPSNLFASATSGNGSVANLSANSGVSGLATITYTIQGSCGNATAVRFIWVGLPNIITMKLDGNNIYPYSPYNLCLYNSYNLLASYDGQVSSVNWSLQNNSSGASISSSSLNGATISSGSSQGSFVLKVSPSNACGSVDRFYVFNANPCGYFFYTVFPNPARDLLTVQFEDAKEEKNFPESFELIQETAYGTVLPLRKLDTKDEATQKKLKSSKNFTFDVKDLPRGRYILRVTKEKENEDRLKIDNIRVVLE